MPRPVYLSQYFRNLDDRIARGAISWSDHWRKAADVVIDGVRLGATPIRMRTPCAGEIRYEKKFEEALILAWALAMKDLHLGAHLRSWEQEGMPDFTGILDGLDRAVEIANVTESGHADGILAKLRNELESITVAPNRFVSISFPMVPLPPRLTGARALEDMAVLAADPTLRTCQAVPDSTRELARAKAKITVAEMPSSAGYIEVTSGANSFNPREMLRVAIAELNDKKACAARYAITVPLWLVLHISDTNGMYAESVELFAELRPEVAPIERVFLTDGTLLADSAGWSAQAVA